MFNICAVVIAMSIRPVWWGNCAHDYKSLRIVLKGYYDNRESVRGEVI
jgi:hypothetical protein